MGDGSTHLLRIRDGTPNEALLGEARLEQVVPKAMSAVKRAWETVTPLAAWLNYIQGTSQFNTSFTIGGGEPDLVASVLVLDGTVLICWNTTTSCPTSWAPSMRRFRSPTMQPFLILFRTYFFLVWILNLSDSGLSYTWTSVNQNLLAGDVAT